MKGTVAFTSLGCDKNRVDSEVMLGLLQERGYQAVADEAENRCLRRKPMKGTVAFTSLGCDKNRVDSEVMLGLLQERGYQAVADEAEADIIVVNTCCFIRDALEESIETILEMAKYKTEGKCKGLIVAGCLGQRYEAEFFDEIPEVDAMK